MQTARPRRIAVIGAGACDDLVYATARAVGALAAGRGYEIVCGGRGGVMAGACQGAREAGGRTIGILAGDDPDEANPFVDVPVVTGLGIARNVLVVKNGQAVIAVAGGAGTLSEIGLALKLGKPVVALGHYGALAGVLAAQDPGQAVDMVAALLGDA
ncbi:TIGR00725 family protein [Solidesulfovibrio sp.]|uniref:TIGR00725 family protein n=1 Tax=Solidesulfovibrio sp. TaxID=2910990 RepID=UPI002B1EE3FE|nr:TIGR00725 family protein [Solidesulfovibrio sp.]MEA4857334.1 TIGR00725 family protein [Solidesulfovibrio sp.]